MKRKSAVTIQKEVPLQAPPFQILITQSPTIELLRANSAPLILEFLWHAFRSSGEIVRTEIWMQQNLADHLEQTQDFSNDQTPSELARRYLNSWCDRHFLRNFVDDQRKETCYMLTRHTEKAFQMLELLQERDFVSTESRFKDIFAKMKEIVSYGQMDSQARLQELENQKEELNQQIIQMKTGQASLVMEDYQIRSRYEETLRLIQELTGDFREVEDNFRELTRQLYEQHAHGTVNSGRLLQETFDGLEALQSSDQGKSFYSFWNFLNDSNSNEELKRLTGSVHAILSERKLNFSENPLKSLKRTLFNAGSRVLHSNRQLAEKLVQVVTEKQITERKRSLELMRKILQNALHQIAEEPEFGLEIDFLPELYLPLERKLNLETEKKSFQTEDFVLTEERLSLEDLQSFYNPWVVDKQQLHQKLQKLLENESQISLVEILIRFPLQKGLPELLSWLSLMQTQPHLLIEGETDRIAFQENRVLRIPQVVFLKGVSDGN